MRSIRMTMTAAVCTVLVLAGCASHRAGADGDTEAGSRPAAEPRVDVTLEARHFDGESLNAAGREKLEMVVVAPESPRGDANAEPPGIVVFLDFDGEQTLLRRRAESVAGHLAQGGIEASRLEFRTRLRLPRSRPGPTD